MTHEEMEEELWRLRNVEIDLARTQVQRDRLQERLDKKDLPSMEDPQFVLNKLTLKYHPLTIDSVNAAMYSHNGKTIIGPLVTDSYNMTDVKIVLDESVPEGEIHIETGSRQCYQHGVEVSRVYSDQQVVDFSVAMSND